MIAYWWLKNIMVYDNTGKWIIMVNDIKLNQDKCHLLVSSDEIIWESNK